MSNKKLFLYYSRLSISEGLNTEINELQMHLGRFDKDIFKNCKCCIQVFAINACVKRLEKVVRIKPHIYIMLKNNAKYRVFTDLHRSDADFIFHREPITGISKKISDEKLDIHLNALLNYN